MRDGRWWRRCLAAVGCVAVAASGCGWILGLDEFVDAPPPGEGGGGAAGGAACAPGAEEACYEGAEETEGVGICAAGARRCGEDGAWGACEGQVVPAEETCANPSDEDCDGQDCVVWARMFGDISDQGATGLAIDQLGDIYLSGVFGGTLDLDPNDPLSTNSSAGFLARFSPEGVPAWSMSIDGINSRAISLDPAGSAIMAATFSGTISVNGQTYQASPYGVLLIKLTSGGDILWVRDIQIDDIMSISSLDADSSGNVVAFGTAGCEICADQGHSLWIRKYSGEGLLLWSKVTPKMPVYPKANAMRVDPFDNILITGAFSGTLTPDTSTLTSQGGYDAYVAKYSSGGSLVWYGRYGGAGDQESRGLTVDDLGAVILVGGFSGDLDFGGDTGPLHAVDAEDVFVAKLSSAKQPLWSRSFGSATQEQATAVAGDSSGSIIVTGMITGPLQIAGHTVTGGGATDLLLFKLSTDGDHLWSRGFGDTEGQVGLHVAADAAGHVLVAGNGGGVVDFGGVTVAAGGGSDVLLARFLGY